jgi:hypothetical protein
MTLTARDERHYRAEQADISQELARYSAANGYPTEYVAEARCACGGRVFRLRLDDEQGVAIRDCMGCGKSHPIGDSADYLEGAAPEECQCLCEAYGFEITVGVSLYEDSEDVRWLYIGCRCPGCGLVGVYGDWKNEFQGYQELLRRI